MSFLNIDEQKCKRDGICVAECPVKVLTQKDPESVPMPIPEADTICVDCGHCVAVCPHGALSHRSMKPEDCPPVRKEWLLGAEQAEHFLRNRRSIRTYKKAPVEREKLEKLVGVAAHAPSGHNRQPVRWLVIHDKETLHTMTGLVADWMRYMIKEQPAMAEPMHMDLIVGAWDAGVDVICRDAPHLILAYGDQRDPTAQAACTIALSYLELAAQPFGLGACWAGYFNVAAMFWPPLQKALALPEHHQSYGAMLIGRPKYAYHRLPLRNPAGIEWR